MVLLKYYSVCVRETEGKKEKNKKDGGPKTNEVFLFTNK